MENIQTNFDLCCAHGKYRYAITVKPHKGVLKKDGTYSKGAVTSSGSGRPEFIMRFWKRLSKHIEKYYGVLIKEYHEDGYSHYHGMIGTSKPVNWNDVYRTCADRCGRLKPLCKITVRDCFDPVGWQRYCSKEFDRNYLLNKFDNLVTIHDNTGIN